VVPGFPRVVQQGGPFLLSPTEDFATGVGAFLGATAIEPPIRGVTFLGGSGFFDESGPRLDNSTAKLFASDPQVGVAETLLRLAGEGFGQVDE
jgi:hypothetical protein